MPSQAEADALVAAAEERRDAILALASECAASGALPTVGQLLPLLEAACGGSVPAAALRRAAARRIDAHGAARVTADALTTLFNEVIDDARSDGAASPRGNGSGGGSSSAGGLEKSLRSGIRRLLLKRRVVGELRFRVWDRLDTWEELELLQLGVFVRELSRALPEAESSAADDDADADDAAASGADALSDDTPPAAAVSSALNAAKTRGGPKLPQKLTPQDVIRLVGELQAGSKLPRAIVTQILRRCFAIQQPMPNVRRVNLKPGQRLTVVGDLHGQLADLLHIFSQNGWPDENSLYVFNGDFVDRGPCGVEVVLALYAWQLCLPDCVYLNRGNHEDMSINSTYGFMQECMRKYDRNLYLQFDQTFRQLPLATIIDDATLVVHAGIDDDLTVAKLDEVQRSLFTLMLAGPRGGGGRGSLETSGRDPWDMSEPSEDGAEAAAAPVDDPKTACSRLVSPVLWSDPQQQQGCVTNARRGAGSKFGPDVAQAFLQREGLKLIIRSHECVKEGYEWPWGSRGMLMTLFSASNYAGKSLNKGAIAVLRPGSAHRPEVLQYEASHVSEAEVDLRNVLFLGQMILEAKRQLRVALFSEAGIDLTPADARRVSTKELLDTAGAANGGGGAEEKPAATVSVAAWARVMGECLKLSLPWARLQPLLAPAAADGAIDVDGFLGRYRARAPKGAAAAAAAAARGGGGAVDFELLVSHRPLLERLLERVDVHGTGRVSADALRRVLALMGKRFPDEGLFGDPDAVLRLLGVAVADGDDVEIARFVDSFRVRSEVLGGGAIRWRAT